MPRTLTQDRRVLILPPNCIYCGRRIRKQGIARHELKCGAGISDRYQIIAVSGSPITGSMGQGGSNWVSLTSYTIVDSYTGKEIFDVWPPPRGGGQSEEHRRQIAEDRCKELNAYAVAS